MTTPLGQVRGQILIDAQQAIAEYAALRAANATTMSALSGSSRALIAVGAASLAAGAGLLALFGKAIGAAAEFEKKIDFFGAVTDATQADMDAVAKKALEMGKTTIFSAGQMADAFVEFGKAGVNTKDILGGVADSVVALASAADIGLTEASDIIISTMQTFKISAGDTMKIADLLAGAANSSIVEIKDLGVSLKYVGGIAAATGVPLKSVVTALALLGQAGIKGSTAGTSLRQILVSLNATSAKSRDELKKLGIITKSGTNLFIDQAGHLKPLDQVFQILKDHTNGLTEAERLSALKIIFNNRALAAANILLKDGSAGFADMAAQIDKVSAADVASKRLDNLSGDLLKLKNTFNSFLTEAGGPFQNFLRTIVQGITTLIQAFSRLPSWVQTTVFSFILFAGVLLTVAGGVSLLVGSGVRIITLFMRLGAVFRIVMVAVRALIIIVRLLGIAFLTNPIGLIITAVALLVVGFILLYQHSKRFRDIIASVGAALVTAFQAVMSFFKGIPDFFIGLWQSIVDIWNNITDAITSAIQAALDFISSVWSTVTDAVLGPIEAIASGVANAFQAVYDAISTAITNIIGFIERNWRVLILITGPLGIMVDIVTAHWAAINNFIHVVLGAIVGAVQAAWNAVVSAVTVAVNFVQGVISTAWNFILAVSSAVWNAIVAVISPIISFLVNVITTDVNVIKSVVSAAWNFIVGVSSAIWNAIRAVVSGAVQGILAAVRGIMAVVGIVGSALSSAYNTVVGWLSTIVNFFAPFASRVLSAIGNLAGTLVSAGTALMTGLYNAVVNTASILWGWLAGLAGEIASNVGNLGSALFDAGVQIIQGLINGVLSMVGSAVSAVKDAVGSAISAVGGFLGIGSPSKVFHQIGRWTMEGFANGITHDKKLVEAALLSIQASVNATTSGLNSTFGPTKIVNSSMGGKFGGVIPPITVTQAPNNYYNVTMTVPADKIKDVAKLIEIVGGIPQAARAR